MSEPFVSMFEFMVFILMFLQVDSYVAINCCVAMIHKT